MSKKILLIVEGAKTEPKLFKRIEKLLNLNNEVFEIISFNTNIYSLYKIMKNNDFNLNIVDLLKELHPDNKEILNNIFIYVYLIFDLDAHHCKKQELRNIKDVVNDNLIKIKEMVDYFNDETDPTIGKLYINYPMIESFKDSDSFFDDKYKNASCNISMLSRYKEMVSKKKLSNLRIESIKDDDLNKIILQNIFKLNYIISKNFEELDYKTYIDYSSQDKILMNESRIIKESNEISVLNTSIFIVIDYFGNNNYYYDNFIKNTINSILN